MEENFENFHNFNAKNIFLLRKKRYLKKVEPRLKWLFCKVYHLNKMKKKIVYKTRKIVISDP